ncbi:MAG: ribosome small subunit-dependent GTPase A [Crocinitomicaceae bacterium]|nr:ribosome small subunit-dependent GTPase A [Flavobacteriales bacterium]NQZ34470.1 ribosome small subunit-dependent GTPase A [Crocinitomicaceae bacterium]
MAVKGKVLKSTGKWYIVELEDGEIVNCRMRGKLRLDGLRTTNPISVGDVVSLHEDIDGEGNRVITGFDKRRNYIVRKSTNLSKQMQILAANIDRAYLIVTLKSPETHLAFIDRFLVSAESFRIPVTLLFNKTDLYSEDDQEYADALCYMYESIGYPCVQMSATEKKNIDFLRDEVNGNQVMISGHSGVGKSTLINAIDSNLDIRTGEISIAHQQGQHTTTFAEMHKVATGGYIVDTPGIRAFGITELEKSVMSHYFPEMRKKMNECKFNNCKHMNEPKCAIKEAVEAGEIDESRYATYMQLMEEDPNETYRKSAFV